MHFLLKPFCVAVLSLSSICFAASEPIYSYDAVFANHTQRFIALIQEEKESISLAAFCLRHSGVVKALIDAQKRGVAVQVVVDPYSVRARSAVKKIAEKNIPLFVWMKSPSKKKMLMHNSFCVFGGKKIWTGSANFAIDQEENCENAIVLEHENLAQRYLCEFEHLKNCSLPYKEFISNSGV